MRTAPLCLLAAIVFISAPVFAAEVNTAPASDEAPKAFSADQRAAVEGIVKDYIAKHPEEIVSALQEMQKRDQASAEEKSKAALSTLKDKIYENPNTPVGGNPKGDVTVVEFYDYQCGYCKMSEGFVEKLLKEDKNVKFLYKNFPILGPVSVTAANAAMASTRQGLPKFMKFHEALMSKKEHLTDDMVYATAKDVGLDVAKLKKDMADEAITNMVKADLALGSDVGVRGTPMFIIGDNIFPGALQYDQMKKAVADARSGKKN